MDKTIRRYTDFDEMKADESAIGRAAQSMSGWPLFGNSLRKVTG